MKRIATLLLGAATLLGASAAVPEFTVDPEQGWLKEGKDFVLTFDGPVATSGLTINMTADLQNGTTTRGLNTGKADGNTIKFSTLQTLKVGGQYVMWGMQMSPLVEGPVKFEIKGYTVDGVEGDPITLEYYLSDTEPVTDMSYTVDPEEGWLKEGKNFVVTFNGEVASNGLSLNMTADLESGTDTRALNTIKAEGNTLKFNTLQTMKVGATGVMRSMQLSPMVEGPVKFEIKGYTVDGKDGDPITIEYYLSNTDPNAEPAEWVLTPANESTVNELKNITISYGSHALTWGDTSDREFYWYGDNTSFYDVGNKSEYGVDGNNLTIAQLPEAYYTPGRYNLVFPAGCVKVDGEATTEKLEFNIYVARPDLTDAKDFEFTTVPAQTEVIKMIKSVEFTFPEAQTVEIRNWFNGNVMYSLKSEEEAADPTNKANWFGNDWLFGGVKAEGNKVTFGVLSSSGINVGNGSWVYINVRPGTLLIDGVPNKAINLKYYVNPTGEASFFKEYDLTPVQGKVEKLGNIELDLFDAVDNGGITLVSTEGSLKLNDEASEAKVTFTTDGEEIINIAIEPEQTAAGSYAVTVPAGTFTVSGLANPEYVFNYTIEAGEEPNPGEGEFAPKAPEDLAYTKTVVRTYTDRNDNTKEYRVRQDYGKIEFTLPITYANGREGEISKDKLFFRVLINDDENVFTFQGPDYIKWEQLGLEPMTWVNDLFQDTYDFGSTDRSPIDGVMYPTKHVIYMYGIQETCERLGVQSKYDRNSKNSYESAIAWTEPAEQDLEGTISMEEYDAIISGVITIEDIFNEGAKEYYNLQGTKVSGTEKGIYICRQTSADGSVRVVKVVK